MNRSLLFVLRMTLGCIMLIFGAALLVRLFVLGMEPAMGRIELDVMMAAFFLLRGVMNLRSKKPLMPQSRPGPQA